MRILLVSAVPPPEGGIASWTTKYITYCEKHGITVELVNTALTGRRGNHINAKRKVTDEIYRTIRVIKTMCKYLKNSSIDIVHINSSCSRFGILRDYVCTKIAKKKGIPVVFHCHCNIRDQIQKTYGVKILKKICDMASEVFVLNSDSLNYLTLISSITPRIIPNFIETDMVTTGRIINEKIENILFVGHVQSTKGFFEILEVARKVPDIKFVLVGPVSGEMNNENLPTNLQLEGARPSSEIKNYLSKTDLFLFPSYTEGFSISLTEAMASGLPCIATDVGANKDMLENKGGIIIPPKNPEAIIEAIHKFERYEDRLRASDWNVNKVKSTYLLDNVMKLIIAVYKKIEDDSLHY